jgi:chitinase
VSEGNSGTTGLVFNVSLSNPSSSTVTLDIRTNDDTAHSPSDYQAGSGQLIFNPGETTGTVTIFVNGDTVKEKNETFKLRLSPVGGRHITGANAHGTIRNDD